MNLQADKSLANAFPWYKKEHSFRRQTPFPTLSTTLSIKRKQQVAKANNVFMLTEEQIQYTYLLEEARADETMTVSLSDLSN